MDSKGYYRTLGVNENASDDEIKKAFRKLSIKYHPDRYAGKSDAEKKEAENKFKEINEAYQTLGDEEKRKQYDNPMSGNMGGFNMGDFGFGGSAFNEIFNSVFGGGGGRRGGQANYGPTYSEPQKGSDVRLHVQLTLEEIFNGCTKTFKYNRSVRCKTCHGAGGIGARKMCPTCGGTGQVIQEQRTVLGYMQGVMVCPECHGKKFIYDKKCPTCGGKGLEQQEYSITVNFEPGIPNGSMVLKSGDGNESLDPKGANGNCHVYVQYAYDTTRYNVSGLDVTERIDIPYYDALLGCDYILTLPNGSKKKINIMTCMPNGKQLKMTGEGISSHGRKGDYYLEVNYTFPQTLDLEERKKLEDIKVINYKKEHPNT